MASALEVGRVTETAIYPVKGMQGIKLDEISLRSVSVVGDRTRAYTIMDATQTPTLLDTTRFPGLLCYSPTLLTPEDPRNSKVDVRTPDGNLYSADSTELIDELSSAYGHPLALVRMGRGAYHSMPVSLMSMGSIKAIEDIVGFPLDPRRFRENVLVETEDNRPYEEDEWLGKLIKFGNRDDSAVIAAVKPDQRCATINMDPETGEKKSGILSAVVKEHDLNLGIYATVVFEGKIRKGDTVFVTPLI